MPHLKIQKPSRLAILGGTFDPIHKGHIEPLLALASQYQWDRIHLLPTYCPPYRQQPIASDKQRIAMIQTVLYRDPRLQLDTWELDQQQPSRTVPTLEHFQVRYPHTRLYFIIGMDSFVQLHTWLNWQDLPKLADLVVLQRPGYHQQLAHPEVLEWANQHPQISFPPTQLVPISSSELRNCLQEQHKDNKTFLQTSLLYQETLQYIQQNGLYLN